MIEKLKRIHYMFYASLVFMGFHLSLFYWVRFPTGTSF